jgi:glycosyltransferase involved in cell wall biosynthesis
MAVRNEERYLTAALRSLQRQTLSDWELVVIDDGSTDATWRLLSSVAEFDRRIRPLQQPAHGLVTALTLGLEHCRAPLIARMDGDDLCHPQRLQQQCEYLRHHSEVDVVTCGIRHFPARLITTGMRAYEDWLNSLYGHDEILRDLYVEAPLVQPSVMLRRRALDAAGGYQDNGWSEDYDLWLRLAQNGARFARLPQTLFFWRDHPQRITRTSPGCTLAAFRACRLHYLRRDYLRSADRVTLWGAGTEGKAWQRLLKNNDIAVQRWIEVDTRKIGQTIHNAPVDPPETLKPGCGPMLITIGVRAARALVRQHCAERGLIEGIDYVCVT